MITVERLREVLSYDPITGFFTWRLSIGRRAKVGARAGSFRKDKYLAIAIDHVTYKSSRLAWLYMTGEWPGKIVDHKDRDKTNDSWENLRLATRRENNANKTRQVNNKAKFKGVNWHKASGRYVAQISNHGKKEHLGLFDTPEEAHEAYIRRAKEVHGEYFSAG